MVDNLYSGKLTWNLATSTTIVGTVFADPTTSSGAAAADPRQGLGVGQVRPPVSLEPSTWCSERFRGGTDFGGTSSFGSVTNRRSPRRGWRRGFGLTYT